MDIYYGGSASYFGSATNGNWNLASNWYSFPGGYTSKGTIAAVSAGRTPQTGDTVHICSGTITTGPTAVWAGPIDLWAPNTNEQVTGPGLSFTSEDQAGGAIAAGTYTSVNQNIYLGGLVSGGTFTTSGSASMLTLAGIISGGTFSGPNISVGSGFTATLANPSSIVNFTVVGTCSASSFGGVNFALMPSINVDGGSFIGPVSVNAASITNGGSLTNVTIAGNLRTTGSCGTLNSVIVGGNTVFNGAATVVGGTYQGSLSCSPSTSTFGIPYSAGGSYALAHVTINSSSSTGTVVLSSGTFNGTVVGGGNRLFINGGTFNNTVKLYSTFTSSFPDTGDGGQISIVLVSDTIKNGTFNNTVTLNGGVILGGTFNGTVSRSIGSVTSPNLGNIFGGTYSPAGTVTISGSVVTGMPIDPGFVVAGGSFTPRLTVSGGGGGNIIGAGLL